MRAILVTTLLALASCATTPQYRTKREAESVLLKCLDEHTDQKFCLRMSADWCRGHGLENTCAVDGLWGQWPRWNNHTADRGIRK
jgi:hypothetical protein